MRYNPVIVVGLGGIGSHLVEPLARYLFSQEDGPPDLVLVDGDSYSEDNSSRQRFNASLIGHNKAEVQAAYLRELFSGMTVLARNVFINAANSRELIVEGSCVFSCVDNHATRKILSDALLRVQNGLLISGGNDLVDGNVQVFWRLNGRNKTPPLDKYHEEIKYPDDENPADLSCEELADLEPSRQIIMSNLMAASLMVNAYYSITTVGKVEEGAEVYFNILSNSVRPRPRP